MPFGIGPLEIVVVLIIVLVIFGPKRLPDLGRSLGKGMREFKDSVTGDNDDDPKLPTDADASEPRKAEQTTADASEPRKAEQTNADASEPRKAEQTTAESKS